MTEPILWSFLRMFLRVVTRKTRANSLGLLFEIYPFVSFSVLYRILLHFTSSS